MFLLVTDAFTTPFPGTGLTMSKIEGMRRVADWQLRRAANDVRQRLAETPDFRLD